MWWAFGARQPPPPPPRAVLPLFVTAVQVSGLQDFWAVANAKIWTGRNEPGFDRFGLLHCVCSAWFCDILLHVGMNDLSILRYGRGAHVGWLSAAGMFPGHYCTWIVAALLYAVQLDRDPQNTSVAPGPMAGAVAGANGLLCVVLAGWSTANPVIYQAGLAFQALLGPGWRTQSVTVLVGVLASVAGLFPALVMRILEMLAFGGYCAAVRSHRLRGGVYPDITRRLAFILWLPATISGALRASKREPRAPPPAIKTPQKALA